MTLANPAVGIILIAVSAAAYFRNRFATLRAVAVFAGILMIGFSGPVVHAAAGVLKFAETLAGATVGKWLGVSVVGIAGAAVAVLVFLVLHDWMPKNSAKKSTYWMSAALAVLIVSASTPFAALNRLPTTLQTGIQSSQGG